MNTNPGAFLEHWDADTFGGRAASASVELDSS